MKKYIILALGLVATNVFANTGVFNGAGSQVMPIKNDAIQLKEEEVNFDIAVPAKHGKKFYPRASVKAAFQLQNTTNQKQDLQIGFPFLDTQFFGDNKSVLKNLNFHAKSADKPYKVHMKEGLIDEKLDPQHLYRKVFAWQDSFEPNQSKQIDVSYHLDMSVLSMDIQSKLATRGAAFFLIYITGTAYTWRPPLENAVFKFDLRSLPKALKLAHRKEAFKETPLIGSSITPLVYVNYELAGQWDNNIMTLSYKDKVPQDGIGIAIEVVDLPAKADEIEKHLADSSLMLAKATNDPSLDPSLKKKIPSEKVLLTNILNFYRGIYQGKMTSDMKSDGSSDSPLSHIQKKVRLSQESRVKFLDEEDRQEVKKIIAILEKKLGVSPSNLSDNPALDAELNKPTDSWLDKIIMWFKGLFNR